MFSPGALSARASSELSVTQVKNIVLPEAQDKAVAAMGQAVSVPSKLDWTQTPSCKNKMIFFAGTEFNRSSRYH